VYSDGRNEIVNDNLSYASISQDAHLQFTIENEEELDIKTKEVNEWYQNLVATFEEGIMIKPRTCFIKGLPPAFKVRNNAYLTLIYGVDFQTEYARNIQRRRTDEKLKCSIFDWMINWELLKVDFADIHPENYFYKNLLYDRIMQENKEMNLDHRL
jgi:hypothetical protein